MGSAAVLIAASLPCAHLFAAPPQPAQPNLAPLPSATAPSKATDANTLSPSAETEILSFKEGMLANLLYAESALWSRQYKVAYDIFLKYAKETNAPEFAKRATQVAFLDIQNTPKGQTNTLEDKFNAFKNAADYWFKLDPTANSAFLVVIETHLFSNDLNAIEPVLKNAIKTHPELAETYWETITASLQSMVYKGKLKPSEAFSVMESLAKQFPDQPAAHLAMAAMAQHTGELELTKTELNKAHELAPEWDKPILISAQILLSEGDPKSALNLVKGYVAKYPDNEEALATLGEMDISTGNFEEAYDIFKRLMAKSPDRVVYTQLAGELAAKTGRYAEAQKYLAQAAEANPKDKGRILLLQTQLAVSNNQIDKAPAYISEIDDQQKHYLAVYLYTQALYKAKQYQKAQKFVLEQYNAAPDKKTRLEYADMYAALLREAKEYKQLSTFFKEALKKDPDEPQFLYEAALNEETLKNYAQSEKLLNRLIEVQPDNAHAYNALGYSYVSRKINLRQARRLLEKADKLMPNDPYIQDSLGWLEFQSGNNDKAIQILKASFDMTHNPEIAAHLGEVYWKMGQRKKAREVWKAGLAADPNLPLLQDTIKRLNGAPLQL